MADTSATVLRLVFGTENGKTASMEFNNPKALPLCSNARRIKRWRTFS
jgi:hypothetical protein